MFRWIITFILLWFIYQVRHVFPPIIVGGIIAYLVLPVVQTVSQRAKIPVGVSTALVYISILAVIVATLAIIGPHIMRELKDLMDPATQHELVTKAVEQVTTITKFQGDPTPIVEQVKKSLFGLGAVSQFGEGIGLLSHGALNLLVCVVSSIYFTLDSQSVGRFFLRYVPENRRQGIIDLAMQMNKMLSKYVQGQIYLIVIMASVAWIFLHFGLHMKYALPVAVFSGFLEIIPVLGPILATGTATLVGIAQFGPQTAAVIIGVYTAARWIEDYVVVPKIIGHAVELHPLAVIFAVLCGETLAGGLGMLIAIPVAACIKLVLDYYYTGELPSEKRIGKKKKHHGGMGNSQQTKQSAQNATNIDKSSDSGIQSAQVQNPQPNSSGPEALASGPSSSLTDPGPISASDSTSKISSSENDDGKAI
ncbi:MAG: AI-2E family transporter [Candidatus Obscuribacterales bacterium]|nr:AI-2E family transporter [Candidatus Obscuribacterales bacterium]